MSADTKTVLDPAPAPETFARRFRLGMRTLFVVVTVVCGVGCGQRDPATVDRSAFTPITEDISSHATLTLYEGLPHQDWESDLYEQELATKKIVRLHKYPFYERPLSVAKEDIETLRRLSVATDSFSPYEGPKPCGAYHPDYCLAWKDGSIKYELLICFGCEEMLIFGPQQPSKVDIRGSAFRQFKVTLKKYRQQRPETERTRH